MSNIEQQIPIAEQSISGVRSGSLESNHITTKFPQYFKVPKIWFAQIEAIFRISNITKDSTKFSHLLANLPPQILMDFQELVTNTSTHAYDDFKTAILSRFRQSREHHVQQLFNCQHDRSSKPSIILSKLRRHMQEISQLADLETDAFLRTAFMKALPTGMRQHLILQADQSLSHLASLADKLETLPMENSIHVITQPQPIPSEMIQTINEIKSELNAIRRREVQRDNEKDAQSEVCYYHRRFGAKANKCQQPCSWDSTNKAGKGQGSH